MKRFISLSLILGISLGVYWARTQAAEAGMRSFDAKGLIAVCRDEDKRLQAVEACDQLLAVAGLRPVVRGQFLFLKARAYHVSGDKDAALATYALAEPLYKDVRWIWLNRAFFAWNITFETSSSDLEVARAFDDLKEKATMIIAHAPDKRDIPYFWALRMLKDHAHQKGDYEEHDRLAKLYVTERPATIGALKQRVEIFEEAPALFSKQDFHFAYLADLTRLIAWRPERVEYYEKRVGVLLGFGLLELAARDLQRRASVFLQTARLEGSTSEAELEKKMWYLEQAREIRNSAEEKCRANHSRSLSEERGTMALLRKSVSCGDLRAALHLLEQNDELKVIASRTFDQ